MSKLQWGHSGGHSGVNSGVIRVVVLTKSGILYSSLYPKEAWWTTAQRQPVQSVQHGGVPGWCVVPGVRVVHVRVSHRGMGPGHQIPTVAHYSLTVAHSSLTVAHSGLTGSPFWPHLVPFWPNLVPFWPNSDQFWSNSDQFWPNSDLIFD